MSHFKLDATMGSALKDAVVVLTGKTLPEQNKSLLTFGKQEVRRASGLLL